MERHYGMDWLRIGAFGLLILYHVGMFFVPWGWHVKTADPVEWATLPMLATNAWRLALLFVVSGYASRALFVRSPRPGPFAGNRTLRLLVPVIFAMIFIIPPQPWVELVTQHGYAAGYGTFWTRDYFRFGQLGGLDLPTWQHLWFVVYLWAYTLVLALLLVAGRGDGVQRLFDRMFGGAAILFLPLGWLLIVRLLLVPGVADTHGLFDDLSAHLVYLPAFLFGFMLAGSATAMPAIARWWKVAAMMAVAGYIVVAWLDLQWPGDATPPDSVLILYRAARAAQTWGAIVALIGIANRFLNRDHRWRPMLTEAVFPFYIVHQTIIVGVGWWLLRFGLPPLAEFVILVAATAAGCWLFYLVGREVGLLRPLIGLRARAARPARSANSPADSR